MPGSASSIRFSSGFRLSVRAVAEALFASHDGPPPEHRLTYLVNELEDYLRHAGLRTRTLVRVSLFAVDILVPILTLHRPLRWTDWRKRVALLERIERSEAGLVVLLIKSLLCLLYYELDEANAELTQGEVKCLLPLS